MTMEDDDSPIQPISTADLWSRRSYKLQF